MRIARELVRAGNHRREMIAHTGVPGTMPQQLVPFGPYATAHYVEGNGPAVLLLHGIGPGTSIPANFGALINALKGECTLIGIDLVGFGGSAQKTEGELFDFPLWVAQAAAALDRLPGPVNVIGHSLGGALALSLAATHPKVGSVVVTGTGGAPLRLPPELDRFWSIPQTVNDLKTAMLPTFFDQSLVTDEIVEDRFRMLTAGGTGAYFDRMMAGRKQENLDSARIPPELLKKIEQRTLFIHGKNDVLSPVEETALPMSRLVKRSDIALLSACGHNPLRERLPTSLALIRDFFAETACAAAAA